MHFLEALIKALLIEALMGSGSAQILIDVTKLLEQLHATSRPIRTALQ